MYTVTFLSIAAICLIHQTLCQIPGGVCTSQSFVNQFPDPTDCSRYYKCIGGAYVDYKCPVGLVFSSTTTACNWPQPGGGCAATTNLNASPVQFPADICSIQPCSKTVDYLLPNYNKPGNSNFYVCKGGLLYEQTCGTSPGTQGYPYYNVLRTSCEKTKSLDSLY